MIIKGLHRAGEETMERNNWASQNS